MKRPSTLGGEVLQLLGVHISFFFIYALVLVPSGPRPTGFLVFGAVILFGPTLVGLWPGCSWVLYTGIRAALATSAAERRSYFSYEGFTLELSPNQRAGLNYSVQMVTEPGWLPNCQVRILFEVGKGEDCSVFASRLRDVLSSMECKFGADAVTVGKSLFSLSRDARVILSLPVRTWSWLPRQQVHALIDELGPTLSRLRVAGYRDEAGGQKASSAMSTLEWGQAVTPVEFWASRVIGGVVVFMLVVGWLRTWSPSALLDGAVGGVTVLVCMAWLTISPIRVLFERRRLLRMFGKDSWRAQACHRGLGSALWLESDAIGQGYRSKITFRYLQPWASWSAVIGGDTASPLCAFFGSDARTLGVATGSQELFERLSALAGTKGFGFVLIGGNWLEVSMHAVPVSPALLQGMRELWNDLNADLSAQDSASRRLLTMPDKLPLKPDPTMDTFGRRFDGAWNSRGSTFFEFWRLRRRWRWENKHYAR